MSNDRRHRPAASLAVLIIIIMLSLAGTAYAAVALGKNIASTRHGTHAAVAAKPIRLGR